MLKQWQVGYDANLGDEEYTRTPRLSQPTRRVPLFKLQEVLMPAAGTDSVLSWIPETGQNLLGQESLECTHPTGFSYCQGSGRARASMHVSRMERA
jgi:hypothetical protein